jgi:ankyrin repeat protein
MNTFSFPGATQRGVQNTQSIIATQSQLERVISTHDKDSSNSSANQLILSAKSLEKFPTNYITHQNKISLLDLSRNRFLEFPMEILEISSLKILRLDSNFLKHLPSEIERLSNLEILTISNNFIRDLPKSLSKLSPSLRILNIGQNAIEKIGHEITDLVNIEALHIYNNFFVSLPSSLGNLQKLRELTLEWFKYANPPLEPYQNIDMYDRTQGNNVFSKFQSLCEGEGVPSVKKRSKSGDFEISFAAFVEHFSQRKADLSYIDKTGKTLLHQCCLYEEIGVLRALLSKGLSRDLLNKLDKKNHTAFSLSLANEKYISAKLLYYHGADCKIGGGNMGSPLHIVCSKMEMEIFNDLISKPQQINKGDDEGNTCLHMLFSNLNKNPVRGRKMIEQLIAQSADLNKKNKENWTPLHLAVKRNQPDSIKFLIELAAKNKSSTGDFDKAFDLDVKGGSYDMTAFHLACIEGNLEMVQDLAEEGKANIFETDKEGNTARKLAPHNVMILKMIRSCERKWIRANVMRRKVFRQQSQDDGLVSEIIFNEDSEWDIKFQKIKEKLKESISRIVNTDTLASEKTQAFNELFLTNFMIRSRIPAIQIEQLQETFLQSLVYVLLNLECSPQNSVLRSKLFTFFERGVFQKASNYLSDTLRKDNENILTKFEAFQTKQVVDVLGRARGRRTNSRGNLGDMWNHHHSSSASNLRAKPVTEWTGKNISNNIPPQQQQEVGLKNDHKLSLLRINHANSFGNNLAAGNGIFQKDGPPPPKMTLPENLDNF